MNAQSPEAQPENMPQPSSAEKGLRLPDPDRDNITVLLHNLPKDPVLPWNHYDSPWQGEADQPPEDGVAEEDEVQALESDTLEPEPLESQILNPEPLKSETGNTGNEETIASEDSVDSGSDGDLQETFAPEPPLPEGAVAKTFEPGFVNLTANTSSVEAEASGAEASEAGTSENSSIEAESSSQEPDQDLLSQLG